MYVYARINKETMKFIRETKAITLDYVSRITKYPSSRSRFGKTVMRKNILLLIKLRQLLSAIVCRLRVYI